MNHSDPYIIDRYDRYLPTTKGYVYTLVFTTFVYMECFGLINNRSVASNQFNVFSGIFGNWMLFLVFFVTAGLTIVIVQFGSVYTNTTALTVD